MRSGGFLSPGRVRAGLVPVLIPFLKSSLAPVFFSFLIMSFISSCAAPARVAGTSGRILTDVPFYPQEKYECGPAALASVLTYNGINSTPEEIASAIFSRTAKGTLNFDMLLYATGTGLDAEIFSGSMDSVVRHIDNGNPLVVLVDYGFWMYQQNHYMVIVGYNENGVIVNSGRESLKFIPSGEFLKIWEKTKYWTLSVKPERQS
jgi:ABC-type bacteriocin/lantibiotic exporter with double-glycine peptidase domain